MRVAPDGETRHRQQNHDSMESLKSQMQESTSFGYGRYGMSANGGIIDLQIDVVN